MAIEIKWTCDTAEARVKRVTAYHGEAVALLPQFVSGGEAVDGLTLSLYWQTRDMGDSWYSAEGSTFAPTMDNGADEYRFFIRAVSEAGDVVYKANGVLTMLASPGFVPSEIQFPVKSIDFATVEVSNAPWALSADLATETTRATKAEAEIATVVSGEAERATNAEKVLSDAIEAAKVTDEHIASIKVRSAATADKATNLAEADTGSYVWIDKYANAGMALCFVPPAGNDYVSYLQPPTDEGTSYNTIATREWVRKQDYLTTHLEAGENVTIKDNKINVALPDTYTKAETANLLRSKQDVLTAGEGISIVKSEDGTTTTISASGEPVDDVLAIDKIYSDILGVDALEGEIEWADRAANALDI